MRAARCDLAIVLQETCAREHRNQIGFQPSIYSERNDMSERQKNTSDTTTAVLDAQRGSKTQDLSDISARAHKLAAEAIGIDSHIDTVQRVLVMGEDLSKRWNVGHVDIPRLHEGGTHAPFFALWVPTYFPASEAGRRTLDLRARS